MSWLHWFDNTALVGFFALGLVAIIASLRVITLANPVHAILSMIVTLLALAGIFFILGAPFAGALQVIVYAGAILVLFVFVIMMLNLGLQNDERENLWLSSEVWAVPTALSIIIAVVLFYILSLGNNVDGVSVASTVGSQTVNSKQVGIALFSEYLLLVEVAALLLLAALVAAYHLGKRALDDENFSHSSQRGRYNSEELNELGIDAYESEQDLKNQSSNNYDSTYQYQKLDAEQFKKDLNQQNAHHQSQTQKREDS